MTDTCRNGHERTEANTAYRNGIRMCLDCQRRKARAPMKRKTFSAAQNRSQGRQKRSKTEVHHLSLRDAVRLVLDEFESVSAAARLSGRARKSIADAAWEQVKAQARLRDKNQCVRCRRAGSNLDVHHRLPKGIGGAQSRVAYGMANLVTLCRSCHEWAHAHPVDALRDGFVVARHDEPADVAIVSRGTVLYMNYQAGRRVAR